MGAPKGNQYWKIRAKDGKDKKYTAEELLEGCNNYFRWCEENPLYEQEVVKGNFTEEIDGKRVTKPYALINVPKMRPFTLHGLCNFLDIVIQTLVNYEKEKDYLDVITHARQIIYNQKFEGAASGFLNPNIIARDLGLADKKDHSHDIKPKVKITYGSSGD